MNAAADRLWYEFRNAVYGGDYELAAGMVADHPHLIESTNSVGETVLHFLAVEDDLDGVSWLHEHGASLDTKNKYGIPVLFEIAVLEYRDLFEWFVQNGTDVTARDSEGLDLHQYLIENEKDEMADWVQSVLG